MAAAQTTGARVFDIRRVGADIASPRWRRRVATVVLVLIAHASLFWMLAGRPSGGEVGTSTLDLTLVDPAAIPVAMPRGSRADRSSGGPPAPGQDASADPVDVGEGDGTSAKGGGGAAALEVPDGEMRPVADAAGDAGGNRQGAAGSAPDGGLGLASGNAYQRLLLRHIRPYRLYPAEAVSRRAEGIVVVRFRVARDGAIEEAWVVKRSRDPALDRAALETIWRAEPVPAVPDDLPAPAEVELPVPFRLPGR